MEIACSMAFRFAMSSSSWDTKLFSSLPSPSSSFAVSTCFSCSSKGLDIKRLCSGSCRVSVQHNP